MNKSYAVLDNIIAYEAGYITDKGEILKDIEL